MSKKNEVPLNWVGLGKIAAVFVRLFTIIKETWSEMGIGLEIIGWVTAEGKDKFVEEFLKPLGQQFLAAQRIIVVNKNTILVNLDAPPILPFDGATVETNKGGGWVTVQKRADGLYVDDRKVILYRSERQNGGKAIRGYELRDEVMNLPVLHPNVMNGLYEHSHLIPEDWKQNEVRFIYFWAVTFRGLRGDLYVHYLFWCGGSWTWDCYSIGLSFKGDYSAAVLESN
ncbi:MAG: hypothetical protein JW816_03755 [Candidatus Buchananbacteria bacterium]|nr:hypothetical protein [Candidatus Buchananbacteria bacterium]